MITFHWVVPDWLRLLDRYETVLGTSTCFCLCSASSAAPVLSREDGQIAAAFSLANLTNQFNTLLSFINRIIAAATGWATTKRPQSVSCGVSVLSLRESADCLGGSQRTISSGVSLLSLREMLCGLCKSDPGPGCSDRELLARDREGWYPSSGY